MIKFAGWLRLKRLAFTHIANERMCNIAFQKKLKAMGVNAGFPDMIVFLPTCLVAIEMKRANKSLSKVSKNQEQWIEKINTYPYAKGVVCYGASEAIKYISELLKNE